jgi:hypothetical protein
MAMTNKFFMAIFVVDTGEIHKYGGTTYKTMSSYVSVYENFEITINKFVERFAKQNYELKEITVFSSDTSFKEDWETLRYDDSVPWSKKNSALLTRRPDITSTNVFCADDFKPRNYRK